MVDQRFKDAFNAPDMGRLSDAIARGQNFDMVDNPGRLPPARLGNPELPYYRESKQLFPQGQANTLGGAVETPNRPVTPSPPGRPNLNNPAYQALLRGRNAPIPSGGAGVAGEQLGIGRNMAEPDSVVMRPQMSQLSRDPIHRFPPGADKSAIPLRDWAAPRATQVYPDPNGGGTPNMRIPGRDGPPPVPPEAGGPGGPLSRGPISGVAAPAATLASMMYSANEQSKDPRSLVYRAVGHSQPGRDMFDLKSYPTSMADVENRGLDTAIAIGELGRGLYNTAMHPIDSVKNAVVGNMTGLAQAMASGYNRLQGNNPNGTRRMPVGPMMMEAPMPAPRDGDPNSPFPDPAATPINKTPARFALDQEDAARQAQRPVAAPRPQTADERYNAYWKAVAPNGLGDYNMRMARDYALSHTPAKDITAHIGNVMSGQGSYEHARAQAQELPKQTAINLRNAMANERTARANEITANRPVRDTRDPVKVAQATTLTAIQDAYKPIFANAKTPQELKAAKDAFYDEWIKAGGKITYDGNQLEMIRNMQGQDK